MEAPISSTFFQSSLHISDSFRSPDPICTSDFFGRSFSYGMHPSNNEANASPCTLSQHPINQKSENEADRQRDCEQDFYKFYENLPEREYDLSMTDLVIQKPLCASDGLPIEDNGVRKTLEVRSSQQSSIRERKVASSEKKKFSQWLLHPHKTFRGPSPDGICKESSLVFPSHLPQLQLPTSSPASETSRGKAPIIGSFTAFSRTLSSKSNRKHFGRISPKVTPMSSPRRSSTAVTTFSVGVNIGLLDVMAPRNVVTANARHKTPGVKIDANSQCSVCSSYTYFFKSRCQVCGRLYCSNCMREAVLIFPEGMKCRKLCAERQSKRCMKKSAESCWPFGSRRDEEDE